MSRKNKKYSAEFKISVIMDMREHHLGYRETARKYELTVTSEASAANMVQRWERIFLEEGAEGLMKERRGKNIRLKICYRIFFDCQKKSISCGY